MLNTIEEISENGLSNRRVDDKIIHNSSPDNRRMPHTYEQSFSWYASLQKEKARKTKTLEEEKMRKSLETRNVYSSFITNLRSPNNFCGNASKSYPSLMIGQMLYDNVKTAMGARLLYSFADYYMGKLRYCLPCKVVLSER